MAGGESAAAVILGYEDELQEELFPRATSHALALKSWSPKALSVRHRIVLALHASGLRGCEIANITGYTQGRVSVIINDPRAMEIIRELGGRVADLTNDVRQRMKLLSHEAVYRISAQLDSTDQNVAQRAAFGILDRAGYGKIEQKMVVRAELESDDELAIVEALQDAGASDHIMDADYSVVEEDYGPSSVDAADETDDSGVGGSGG